MKRCVGLLVALAAVLPAQESLPQGDAASLLRDAISHARYGARLSAARKLADLGDGAVPALEAQMAAHGLDSIPMQVVDALATGSAGGAALRALLARWADEPAFYWRSLALRGLVERRDDASLERFRRAVADPSHLMRIQGGRGLWLVGTAGDRERVLALLSDPDPRVPVPVAAHLLQHGDLRGVPLLEHALTWRDEFLGDAWGLREAQAARRALANAFPQRELRRLEAQPQPQQWAGGLELRSCRNGDLFLRWTDEGQFRFGLRGGPELATDRATAGRLRAGLSRLPGRPVGTHGTVVCDFVQASAPGIRHKAAPGALPAELATWLEDLAEAICDDPDLQEALLQRLPQFTGRSR